MAAVMVPALAGNYYIAILYFGTVADIDIAIGSFTILVWGAYGGMSVDITGERLLAERWHFLIIGSGGVLDFRACGVLDSWLCCFLSSSRRA